jgi:glutamate racemase
MTIGFFDSGVGGLTVLAEALRQLPEENYIYYADTEHVPYGIRNKDEVRRFVLQAVDFMAAQNIKALVVACNTATSIAINNLRQKYDFPVLGMEPAVKPAVEKNGTQKGLKRVLVAATQLTLREQKYQDLVSRVDQDHIVDGIALPELVEYAENFVFSQSNFTLTFILHKKNTREKA